MSLDDKQLFGELEAVKAGIDVLSQSADAQDLCRRIAHADFMGGFCQGVAVYLLDQRSVLVEVASYGRVQQSDLEITAWDENVMSKAVRSRKIAIDSTDLSTSCALPLEISGVITGAFLFNLSNSAPTPAFSVQVTSMLSSLGGLFMDNKGLSLRNGAERARERATDSSSAEQELTTRQLKIMELMADGLTNAEIAKLVLLSESTVRQETIRIFRIFNCHSRTEAIVKARAAGIIAGITATGFALAK
jgi:DNA-binding CsgD family transcriptional regulator